MTHVSAEMFAAWRRPRFGTANPERLDNALWASLVHDPINAYQVNKRYGHETWGAGATWCFDRFGRSSTTLPDGRVVHVAGEHEDYYDPDFFIYNDVIVVAPDESVTIFGYPRDVFPPTDFHTATLVGNHIWLVGNLGYGEQRVVGTTQVARLDVRTFEMEMLATAGENPGWIHKHVATLDGNHLVIAGGLVEVSRAAALEENIDEWALDLATCVWRRRTHRPVQRWSVRRIDGKTSSLWEMRQLAWHDIHGHMTIDYRARLVEQLGTVPDVSTIDRLYAYDNATLLHEREGDNAADVRIELDGVVVKFTENMDRVVVLVEGELREERLRGLQQHVIDRLSALHATPWERV